MLSLQEFEGPGLEGFKCVKMCLKDLALRDLHVPKFVSMCRSSLCAANSRLDGHGRTEAQWVSSKAGIRVFRKVPQLTTGMRGVLQTRHQVSLGPGLTS